MLSPNYYQRQAEICSRLATAAGDPERAMQFKVLALEMLLRAADAIGYADDRAPVSGIDCAGNGRVASGC